MHIPELSVLLTIVGIGLAGGILSGMLGVGGGIILVPAMVYFLGLSQKTAQGTTLALLMFPVVAAGVYTYHQKGHVEWSIVLWMALGFVGGALLGARVVTSLPDAVTIAGFTVADPVKKIFALLLLYVAIRMLVK